MIGLVDPEIGARVTRKLKQGRDDLARKRSIERNQLCLLYTSDAADE